MKIAYPKQRSLPLFLEKKKVSITIIYTTWWMVISDVMEMTLVHDHKNCRIVLWFKYILKSVSAGPQVQKFQRNTQKDKSGGQRQVKLILLNLPFLIICFECSNDSLYWTSHCVHHGVRGKACPAQSPHSKWCGDVGNGLVQDRMSRSGVWESSADSHPTAHHSFSFIQGLFPEGKARHHLSTPLLCHF